MERSVIGTNDPHRTSRLYLLRNWKLRTAKLQNRMSVSHIINYISFNYTQFFWLKLTKNKKLPLLFPLVRLLEGHEYGGQCVAALDTGVVYSASLDRTLRSWDANTGDR